MTNPIITLTSDFGTGSPYVAQMKGVILSINPTARIVDISHDIPPQDVRQGAVVLADATPLFPRSCLHVAVVDPGVGSDRKIVYAHIGGQAYIAPDNGLLSRVTQHRVPDTILALNNPDFWRQPVSSTFHGRDILAPAAAHISLGTPPEHLGQPAQSLVTLEWPTAETHSRGIRGSVLQIDSFGNVVSDITREQMAEIPRHGPVRVACRGYMTDQLVTHYDQQPLGSLVALFGSAGRLELSVCGGSAAQRMGSTVGDPFEVSW